MPTPVRPSRRVSPVRPIRRHASAGLLLPWLLVACGSEPPPIPSPEPATARTTGQGEVIGFVTEAGAHAWRGLPFAAPPVGDLRWRAPRPPRPWAGVREALVHGAECVQLAGPLTRGAEAGTLIGDEDCLYLNVYAPAREGVRDLPVMVWIHGGGNTIGSANVYDGGHLADQQDVVVVTLNYRLGVFGWFVHPALFAPDASVFDRSGNYGTLDLVRALEWVRDEIVVFGGDPTRVTVFGESAGGVDVYSLLLAKPAAGLFHRAIVQSGGVPDTTLEQAVHLVDDAVPGEPFSSGEVVLKRLVAAGRAADRDTAKALAARMDPAAIAALLRDSSAAEMLGVYDGARLGGMYEIPMVFRDGHVLPAAAPAQVFAAGDYNAVPVVLGTNRDETKLFALFGSPHVTRAFRIPLWISDEQAYEIENEYPSSMWKARAVDEPATWMRASQAASVFAYRFDWDEEPSLLFADFSKMLGAAHGLEIPFVFGRLRFPGSTRIVIGDEARPGAEQLSAAMMSYWANIAHTGDPGRGRDGKLPHWQAWGAAPDDPAEFIVLDSEAGGGIRMSSDTVTRESVIARIAGDERLASAAARCEIYASFVLRGGAMTRDEYARVGDGECASHPLEP